MRGGNGGFLLYFDGSSGCLAGDCGEDAPPTAHRQPPPPQNAPGHRHLHGGTGTWISQIVRTQGGPPYEEIATWAFFSEERGTFCTFTIDLKEPPRTARGRMQPRIE